LTSSEISLVTQKSYFDLNFVQYIFETISFQDFGKFVKLESMPLVLEFSQQMAPQIFGSDIKKHFLLFVAKSDKEVHFS
jgi:hypothetical protein